MLEHVIEELCELFADPPMTNWKARSRLFAMILKRGDIEYLSDTDKTLTCTEYWQFDSSCNRGELLFRLVTT